MKNTTGKAFGGLVFVLLAMAALLFLPAWTLNYWQAWVLLAVFGGSALATTLYLMKHDPELLDRRTRAGPTSEKQTNQKIIQTITSRCCKPSTRSRIRTFASSFAYGSTGAS